MDALGFALATAFLASVFTVFGIVERLIAGVAAEIRYSVAPGVVSGVQAWAEERRELAGEAGGASDRGGPGDGSTVEDDLDTTTPDRHDPGLVVPVQGVPRRHRGWHLFARSIHALAAATAGSGRS